jgi:serine/threonine protein kinase
MIVSGGFGTVYCDTDMDANAKVAIKALQSDLMSARDKEDFKKEVLVCFIDMVRILDVVR